MPADTYLDQKLPYTQTGNAICNYVFFIGGHIIIKGGLATTLHLKKWVPVMITVNSNVKRYKENGKL